jgi:RNase P/RNase MRP subunit p30
LNVQVESILTVSPTNLSLGTVKMGDSSDRKIVVRGTQPFTILGVEGLDDNWVVKELSKEKKEVHVITLSFKANREGDLKHKVVIKTDIPESGTVELTANALVNR